MYPRVFPVLKNFCSGYFNLLLVFLCLLFAFRPYNSGPLYFGLWQFLFTGVMLASIFNCNHSKKIKVIVIALAIPAFICNVAAHFYISELLEIISLTFTALFLIICVSSIITKVILNAKVTVETLKGVICVYLMVGYTFAYLFMMVEFISPGSFYFIDGIRNASFANVINHYHYLSQLMFFSFVTQIGIGYGDIHPLRDTAQTLSVFEGIIGQFYIAILVSRLISIYSFYSKKPDAKEEPPQRATF